MDFLSQEEINSMIIDIYILENEINKHQNEIKDINYKLENIKTKLYKKCKHNKVIDYTQHNERTSYNCTKCRSILN
jgi:hypothetical protein